MDNLEIYNKLKEVPKEAQKQITGGRLNGMTDIKPMWRIEKLTEVFGPVGLGWHTKTLKKELIPGANNEIIAIVDIELYVNYKKPYELEDDLWSIAIEGSGGSSFIAKEKSGLYTNDECFKMAYTDALSVACKSLGMGASVYWGDSKYNTTQKITKQDALDYKFTKGKYQGKSIADIYEQDRDYLQWWLDQGKDETIRQMILLITDMKPTEIRTDEELSKIVKLQELVNATNTDYESLKKHYGVESDLEMTESQLDDAIKKLEARL